MPDSSHEQTLLQLRAAQAGDSEAAQQLFARYRERLLQVVCLLRAKLVRDLAEDEEDIVQDALLAAFRKLDGFEPRSEGAFLHWLSKLAENRLRDTYRRQRTRKRGEGRERAFADLSGSVLISSLFPGKEPAPSELARANELGERIEAAVIALPERERRAFVMRRMCGLPFEQIADELGLATAGSARKCYSRLLANLSARLPELTEP